MGFRLPKELEREILSRCGEAAPKRNHIVGVNKMVEPGIAAIGDAVVLTVATETKNELNQRDWKTKNRRAGAAWKSVREAVGANLGLLEPLARHLASGGAVRAKFVRLGGRKLDQLANLGAAFKGVEDAICYLLGINDNDHRWRPEAGQDTEADLVGVRIELERFE